MSSGPMVIIGYREASLRTWLRKAGGLTVFLGENGAGKSRLLSEIAIDSVKKGGATIVVANTPYDRFNRYGSAMKRLLARKGSTVPEKALKNAISNGVSGDEVSLKRVSRVLQHCGYQPDVGVQIKVTTGKRRTRAEMGLLDKLTDIDKKEVLSVCEVLLRSDISNQIFWFDFDSAHLRYSYREVLPKVLRWELLLKKMKIISGVKLHLMKGRMPISLSGASSGELSLIATMAFIATTIEPGACVIIDEPENSLHPRWQREYLGILLEVLKYRRANIFIATHSPLVISELDGGDLEGVNIRTIIISSDTERDRINAPSSVEGILVEAFRTVTPENHYLSRLLADLLNSVDSNSANLASVKSRLDELRNGMPDEKQAKVIDAVEEMAEKIASGDYK